MPVGVGGKPAAPPAAGGGFKPGGGGAAPAKPTPPPAEPPAGAAGGGGKKKLVLIVVVIAVLALLVGGGVFLFMMLAGGGEETAEETAEETEKVIEIGEVSMSSGDVMNINLAEGHFVAFAGTVYFSTEVEAAGEHGGGNTDNTPFRDTAIDVFMGQPMEKLCTPKGKTESQEKLRVALNELPFENWHGKVAAVEYSTFACQ